MSIVSARMSSFLLLLTLSYFSHLIRAAAAPPPTLTNTPQLLQLPPLQQHNNATVSSPDNTSSNRFYTWNIPNTLYDIYIITVPPYLPTLPIIPLSEVYIIAINECAAKIAQGLGGHSSENLTFTAQDVQLDWEVSVTGAGLNYSMLSRVFALLVDLNVRPASPLPDLVAKDLSFTVAHRIERRYTGSGVVSVSEAGNEVLAKRSLNPSPAPHLLQPLALDSTRAISKRQSVNPLHEDYAYEIPSTPYCLLVTAYSDHLIPITPLQEVYSEVISALGDKIAQGRGAAKSVDFVIREPPVTLTWTRVDERSGLNYTDLLKAVMALKLVHLNRETPWHAKMIWYNIVMPKPGQELVVMGGGRVEDLLGVEDLLEVGPPNVSVQTSKRDLVNPANPLPSCVFQFPNTPYILNITAITPSRFAPQLPLYRLLEIYGAALHDFAREISSGHGGDVPAKVEIELWGISLVWRREDPPGLNYTMLRRVYQLLDSLQTNPATPFPEGYRMGFFFHVMTTENDSIGIGWVTG